MLWIRNLDFNQIYCEENLPLIAIYLERNYFSEHESLNTAFTLAIYCNFCDMRGQKKKSKDVCATPTTDLILCKTAINAKAFINVHRLIIAFHLYFSTFSSTNIQEASECAIQLNSYWNIAVIYDYVFIVY